MTLCQTLVWFAWKPDSGSVLAQQLYSLKLKSPCKGGRSVHFLSSKTADHAQPTPNLYLSLLFMSLTIVRFGFHPPSALGFSVPVWDTVMNEPMTAGSWPQTMRLIFSHSL